MKKEYRISPAAYKRVRWQVIAFISLSVLMLLTPILVEVTFSMTFKEEVDLSGIFSSSGLLCLFLAALYMTQAFYLLQTLKTHLILSPTHLEFHSVGIELKTEWRNILRIGKMPLVTGKIFDTFVLREPPEQTTSWWLYLLNGGRLEQQIPLSLFDDWRDTEILQKVQRYAPHLFQ